MVGHHDLSTDGPERTIAAVAGNIHGSCNPLNLSPVVTICTTSLTFSNSTFRPYNIFMCFVWISEQTVIISLYSINWLVFITEKDSVYCAVRAEFLYTFQGNVSPQMSSDTLGS